MAQFAQDQMNMDGSEDPYYRYQMPKVLVKVEGTSKMRKSVLVNLADVCRSVGRPVEHVLTYLGQSFSAATKIEKDTGKAYVTGAHSVEDIQLCVLKFIQETIMCHHCHLPETSCQIEGTKKKKDLFLSCKACQKRSNLDSSDRFVKFMIQHPPPDTSHGHAGASDVQSTYREMAEAADAESTERKSKKIACPDCGHRTSKTTCSKCSASLVKTSASKGAEDDVHSEPDLDSSMGQWMVQSTWAAPAEDLCAWLRCQGHTKVSAPEMLSAVVVAVAGEALVACDLAAPKLQPAQVASEVAPAVQRRQLLIRELLEKVGDAAIAADVVVRGVQNGTETVTCGLLLCFRDLFEDISDNDLASACKKLADRGRTMEKFIDFLERDDEGSDCD